LAEEKFEGLRLSQTQIQEVGAAAAVPELVISDVSIVEHKAPEI
jgi:hypothetical protein